MAAHTERLMRIYNRLKRGPVTIEIIKRWAKQAGIEVSERQLYRDLNQLKVLQLSDNEKIIEFADEKNRKTWKLEFISTSEKITLYDINSFYLLKNFAPYSVLEERKKSIEKFESIIFKSLSQNNFQHYIQANELYLRKTNYNDNMYGETEHAQLEDLIWALHNNKAIIIENEIINTADINIKKNDFPLKMYPMELIFHRGRIHVAGFSEKKQFLIFAIDKLFVFRITNQIFNRKKLNQSYTENFEKLYGISAPIFDKVYNIELIFSESYGTSFKNFYWHHSQQWKQQENGSYTLTMQCTITRELLGFVAIGLDLVQVRKPKILKDLVIKKLQDTLAAYNKI